jgi:hypothetical protein
MFDLYDTRFVELLDRLGRMSIEDYYNPYRTFEWPQYIPADRPWMTRELLSVYGTRAEAALKGDDLVKLSVYESLNFYSLNVHGIRELITEVINRVHLPGFEVPSEFFHHFVGEENEHMWFFAEFCKRYCGKLYYLPQAKTTQPDDHEIETFLVFSRILIFEEIVDYYNSAMAADETLHETIRQINAIHHRDESRHIAFGRELVSLLCARLRERLEPDRFRQIGRYLYDYLDYSLKSFYSLDAYDDAGIPEPLELRRTLIADPARQEVERKIARKPLSFFRKIGVFEQVAA